MRGHEAVFFEGPEELTEKIQLYLKDAAARRRIALAGQHRCQTDGYATAQQFSRITDWLEREAPTASFKN